jgi:hypothetical protein
MAINPMHKKAAGKDKKSNCSSENDVYRQAQG